MSDLPVVPGATVDPDAPLPHALSRRIFLARVSAVAATAAAAGPLVPGRAFAASTPGVDAEGDVADPAQLADPTELTIAEAAAHIRRGTLTPEHLVRAYLERIERFEGVYKAFNVVLADRALARARALGRQRYRGPLHGIPLAIKDNYFTEGVPTTANSFIFRDFVPPFDSTVVARLQAAGAIVLGKTQMGPLATTRATTPSGVITTVNAWTPEDPSVNPGGSSTGSATATAGRLATSSTGTQTGGSITGPSNAQNLTGLKPTMGRVSLYGIIPLSFTRDHPGPLARDARDAAIMLQAMAGPDENDFRTLGLPRVPNLIRAATPVRRGRQVVLRYPTRIGVIPGYTAAPDSPDVNRARTAFLETLAGVPGATVLDVTLPDEWELLTGNEFNNVRLPERTEPFRPFLRQDLKLFGVSLISWLQGALLSGDEYLTGQRAKVILLERVLDRLFLQCDVVVQVSPIPFDIIGLPEIALPIGFGRLTTDGPTVPIGTILGAMPYAEDRLLAVAAAYQALTEWHERRPPDPGTARASAQAERAAAPDRLSALEVAALTE